MEPNESLKVKPKSNFSKVGLVVTIIYAIFCLISWAFFTSGGIAASVFVYFTVIPYLLISKLLGLSNGSYDPVSDNPVSFVIIQIIQGAILYFLFHRFNVIRQRTLIRP
jgi:hypothetical protein